MSSTSYAPQKWGDYPPNAARRLLKAAMLTFRAVSRIRCYTRLELATMSINGQTNQKTG